MRSLLVDEYPLIVLPSLAKEIGLNEAIMLQQIHFWLGKKKHYRDGRYWVYNTYDEWEKQFPFWSQRTIRRTISSLEKKELIITANYNKLKIDRTKWYTIDYDVLKLVDSPCGQNDQMGGSNCPDGYGQFDQSNYHRLPETNDIDDNISTNPFTFYENNFGILGPFVRENIAMWCEDLSDELVIEAMKKALLAGEDFRYVNGILKAWHKKKIRTLDDVKAEQVEFENKFKKKPKKKKDIDWDNL